MILQAQYRYEKLARPSYLIGCARAKEGVIVDPSDDLGAESYVPMPPNLGLEHRLAACSRRTCSRLRVGRARCCRRWSACPSTCTNPRGAW